MIIFVLLINVYNYTNRCFFVASLSQLNALLELPSADRNTYNKCIVLELWSQFYCISILTKNKTKKKGVKMKPVFANIVIQTCLLIAVLDVSAKHTFFFLLYFFSL